MEVTQKAKDKIKKIFPELYFIDNGNDEILLKGNLVFEAKYIPELNSYEFLARENNKSEISGNFSIEINLLKENPYREVYEIGGGIERIADELGYGVYKLHRLHARKHNPFDKKVNVCVSGYLQEDQNIDLVKFVCGVVAAFFCDVVVFKNKHIWPRGEIKHFLPGLFESYAISLENGDVQRLTEKCLNEFLNQKIEKNFVIYKELLLHKGKIRGDWRKNFWDEDKQGRIEDIIRNYMGKISFEGLWKFKENLLRLGLINKI